MGIQLLAQIMTFNMNMTHIHCFRTTSNTLTFCLYIIFHFTVFWLLLCSCYLVGRYECPRAYPPCSRCTGEHSVSSGVGRRYDRPKHFISGSHMAIQINQKLTKDKLLLTQPCNLTRTFLLLAAILRTKTKENSIYIRVEFRNSLVLEISNF